MNGINYKVIFNATPFGSNGMDFVHVVMNVPFPVNGVSASQGDILSIITADGVKHEVITDANNAAAVVPTTSDDSTCNTMPGGVSCWKKITDNDNELAD